MIKSDQDAVVSRKDTQLKKLEEFHTNESTERQKSYKITLEKYRKTIEDQIITIDELNDTLKNRPLKPA